MAEIIKKFLVRSSKKDRPQKLSFCFDTGSPYTFIKQTAIRNFKVILELPPELYEFKGLGDGIFYATHVINMEVRMLGIWCRHLTYVIEDDVMEERYDVLLGHDFLQRFGIKIDLKKEKVILDKATLKSAQRIKTNKI